MTLKEAIKILGGEIRARFVAGAGADELTDAMALGLATMMAVCEKYPNRIDDDFEEDEEQ